MKAVVAHMVTVTHDLGPPNTSENMVCFSHIFYCITLLLLTLLCLLMIKQGWKKKKKTTLPLP